MLDSSDFGWEDFIPFLSQNLSVHWLDVIPLPAF